ncbi:MAG: hypothetical protein IJO68_08380 [Clostridia bacterium]|nr:hypothetical protein [Clostridia bacterium]
MKTNNSLPLTLSIVTSEGSLPVIQCDSVNIIVRDSKKGKGGGSYTIHKNHAGSLFATASGTVTAFANGEKIFSSQLDEGFCSVENNLITVISAK